MPGGRTEEEGGVVVPLQRLLEHQGSAKADEIILQIRFLQKPYRRIPTNARQLQLLEDFQTEAI